jgi:hypothetical protein
VTVVVAPPEVVTAPSTLWVPPRRGSYGPEIIDFADAIGLPLDVEQRRDIDAMASYGPGGRWLTLETAIIEGRQNGKTKDVVLPIAMADLWLFSDDPDKIFWTSHLMKTSRDTFDRVLQLIEGSELLSSRVKEIVEAKSEEAIILTSGASMEFVARTGGGGRGLGGKRLVFDEALFLSSAPMGSLIPTLSARGNPQITYASSAGKAGSDHLRSLQERGRRGGDPSLILVEYRAPGGWDNPGCTSGCSCPHLFGTAGCSLDDEDRWRRANHAIGRGRITLAYVRQERRALGSSAAGVIEFGRERLGWEELGSSAGDPDRIPAEAWTKCVDPVSAPVGPVVFSVDMPPGGAACSIGMAGRRADGLAHVGVVDYRRGTDWVAARLVELVGAHPTACAVVWQPAAPVGGLAAKLETAGVALLPMTGVEMAQACGAFKDDVVNGALRHQGTSLLDDAFASAERRVGVEGAWTWGRRKSAGDISPLVAVTEALWGLSNGPGQPSVWSF